MAIGPPAAQAASLREDLALFDFFRQASKYIVDEAPGPLASPELAQRWTAQTIIDELVAALHRNDADKAITLAQHPDLNLFDTYIRRWKLRFVQLLLTLGSDPNEQTAGRHTPLYIVANECKSSSGPAVVHAVVTAGANVNAANGVKRCTPLHMAARRGHTAIAEALLACGADLNARDSKGDTPLMRARNCRKPAIWYKGLK